MATTVLQNIGDDVKKNKGRKALAGSSNDCKEELNKNEGRSLKRKFKILAHRQEFERVEIQCTVIQANRVCMHKLTKTFSTNAIAEKLKGERPYETS